jgi:acetoin utilization deacetylase AcuC-like enzyme
MSLTLITHPAFALHRTPSGHPEQADRIKHVWSVLEKDFADLVLLEAEEAGREAIERVHGSRYMDFIASQEPGENGGVNMLTSLDPDTHMSRGSLEAGMRAAGGAVQCVDQVMTGQCDRAFLAARPPGHHAEPDRPMGFCLFSSAAIAAQHARAAYGLTRVAVLDFDVHHGNGTQAVFWDDGDLTFASSHQMPLFPGTGARDEDGVGNIHNAPMRAGDDGGVVIDAWKDVLLPAVKAARPELVIISAGFDAHADDPLGGLNMQTEDFATLTAMFRQLAEDCAEGRIVSLLEGGYNLKALQDCVRAHLNALR